MTTNTPILQELSAQQVQALQASGGIVLIDVREPGEYESERIPGALLYPLSTFDPAMLPPDEPRQLVFQCGSGKRSAAAAALRAKAGATRIAHLTGGIAAWRAAGLPLLSLDPASGQIRRS